MALVTMPLEPAGHTQCHYRPYPLHFIANCGSDLDRTSHDVRPWKQYRQNGWI